MSNQDHTDASGAPRPLAGGGGRPRQLARLLAAAAAPPQPHELAGEDAAVAAFHAAAHAGPVVAGRPPRPRHRRNLRRLVTVKAAALVGAVVVTGVALAAGAGVLPGPPNDRPGPASPASAAIVTTGSGETRRLPHPSSDPTIAPGVAGLCRAYLAQVARGPTSAPLNPQFAELIRIAGDADRAVGYCAALLGEPTPDPRKDKDKDRPSHPARSPGRP